MALKEKIVDRAQKYIQKGYYDKAIAEYKSALDIDPRDISIRLRLGDLYVKSGKKPEAIKEYTDVAKANSQRGFYLKGIAVYKQVLKLDDSNVEVHYKLAELYSKQRLIADSISEYSYIVSLFEKKGMTSEVMELLKKMIEIDQENIGVRLKLADLFTKLSFEKDAIVEYAVILEKLLAKGKLERAEKIFLGLYESSPDTPEILSGLADIYEKKGDEAQVLKFKKSLLAVYTQNDEIEEAKVVSESILEVKPDDQDALSFMEQFKTEEKEEPVAPEDEPLIESPEVGEPAEAEEEEAPSGAESADEPLISWPEDDIEISVEGFEQGGSEEVLGEETELEVKEPEEAPTEEEEVEVELPEAAGEVAEAVAPESEESPIAEAEVEVELPESAKEAVEEEVEIDTVGEAAEKDVEVELPEAAGEAAEVVVPESEESPITEAEEEVEVELSEAAGEAVEVVLPESEEPPAAEGEEDVEVELPESAGMAVEQEAEIETVEKTVEEPEEELPESEDEAVEEEVELETLEKAVEEPEEESPLAASEAMEEAAPVEEEAPVSVTEEVSLEEVVEEGEAEESAPVEILPPDEVDPTPDVPEEIAEEIEQEKPEEPEEIEVESPEAPEPEEQPAGAVALETPEPGPEEAAAELSEAFDELMEKMEPVEAEEPLLESYPEKVMIEEGAVERKEEEYVDLTAELGMEEALEDLAGSWGGEESDDTFDEFKSGIGEQLSQEDTETHYNLGIAYMEMELYDDAIKEFKIALKDPRLELDCYTRLGLCEMAGSEPQEAIVFYKKGLSIEGKTDDERKGMMYELALAHEAAGEMEDAADLFKSIEEIDPDYREIKKKIAGSTGEGGVPHIPLDDGLIEVELL